MPFTVASTRLLRRILDVLLVGLVALVVVTLVVARVVPVATGGATFVVGGGSMDPTIPIGSLVIVTPAAPRDLSVGDVVSVKVGEQQAVFTHRITRLVSRADGLWLETKGDANAQPDPSIVPAASVIGREAVNVPYAGYVLRLLGSVPGVIVLMGLGIFLLAGAWLLETIELDHRMKRRYEGHVAARIGSEHAATEGATG